jgi:sulfur relay (sulfurtransferase) complex TusBCD TusD component (DsrE family)
LLKQDIVDVVITPAVERLHLEKGQALQITCTVKTNGSNDDVQVFFYKDNVIFALKYMFSIDFIQFLLRVYINLFK